MSETNNTTTTEQQAAELPPFYRNPVPLNAAQHAQAGLAPRASYAFARNTNAILLTVPELASAALHYPIVFSAAPVVPFAVVGLRDRENVFVDDAGQWREDTYVPAYVRRYPFIFVTEPGSSRLVLCVDEAAENFEESSGQPFFVEDKPGPGVQEVLRFCESFQAQYEDTLQFGRWLDENNLLEDRIARAELGDGAVFTLRGFRLINPEKLRTLTDTQLLHLHHRNWLPLLHFHQQSLGNWSRITRLMQSGDNVSGSGAESEA